MNQDSKRTLIEVYAKTWETLNVDLLIPFLDDKFTYSSMWVLGNLDHDGYIDYLRGKFDCIKKTNSKIEVKIGYNEIGDLAVVLRQDYSRIAFITITEENGKITSAYMCAF